METKDISLHLSVGYLGLQIAFGLESANLSRIFQQLGAANDQLALLWLAGPVTGLLIQPIIGWISDHSWSSYGRRRPFIVVSAGVVVVALWVLPRSSTVGWAVLTIWILETAMNALHAPYRALVGDCLAVEHYAQAYSMQTLFIGLGAFLGACSPSLIGRTGLSGMAMPGVTSSTIRLSFLVAGMCVALAVGWTVAKVREPKRAALASRQVHPVPSTPNAWRPRSIGRILKGFRPIAIVQFFSWTAMYVLWVYATPVVSAQAFGARNPFEPAYTRGADWVGLMFGIYNGVAALFALFLPRIIRGLGLARAHALALMVGAVAFAGIAYSHSAGLLLGCSALIGVAYASIISIPFVKASGILRAESAGISIGIMNVFIVLPQLLAGLLAGSLIDHLLHGRAELLMLLAGAGLAMGALACLVLWSEKSWSTDVMAVK